MYEAICTVISCDTILRVFWNELQAIGFGSCFSAIFICQSGEKCVFVMVWLSSSASCSSTGCSEMGWSLVLAFLPCFALTRQLCRSREPVPSQSRPAHSPAEVNSPFVQFIADSLAWGESKQRETLQMFPATCVPLDCLQHPEQLGQLPTAPPAA